MVLNWDQLLVFDDFTVIKFIALLMPRWFTCDSLHQLDFTARNSLVNAHNLRTSIFSSELSFQRGLKRKTMVTFIIETKLIMVVMVGKVRKLQYDTQVLKAEMQGLQIATTSIIPVQNLLNPPDQ